MLVVLPFHEGDRHLTEKNLSWAIQLDKQTQYECLLSYDNDTSIGEVQSLAEKYFSKVHTHRYDAWPGEKRWPFPQNNAFQKTARYIPTKFKDWWMWWESDMVPLKPGWLKTIEDEYLKAGKAFMGAVVKPHHHINGAGCYPNNVAIYSHRMLLAFGNPWDVEGGFDIQEHKHDASHIFQHEWHWEGHPPTFPNADNLQRIIPTAVTFHRNKDGTLVDRLREKTGLKAWIKNVLASPKQPPVVPKNKVDMPCLVQLGRYGDIINILPVVHSISSKNGTKCPMVVAKKYADVLDGVSYVDPIVYRGDFSDLNSALPLSSGYKETLVSQVYSKTHQMPVPQTDSFVLESWHKIGFGQEWGNLPLVFDRRDQVRESRLLSRLPLGKPWILFNTKGQSSPYPFGVELVDQLIRRWSKEFHFIDLMTLKAERIYDLIGVYERATALITIDTATLHLAAAVPQLPIIALITHAPTMWHGTKLARQPLFSARYNQPKEEQFCGIHTALTKLRKDAKLHHVYLDYKPGDHDKERLLMARQSSALEYANSSWQVHPIADENCPRSFDDDGVRRLTYLVDVFDVACLDRLPTDIIVFTNTDICLSSGLGKVLLEHFKAHRCAYARRSEIKGRIIRPLSAQEIAIAPQYCGVDLLAFTVEWWKENRKKVPDFLMGAEAWDFVVSEFMYEQDKASPLPRGLIYHQEHSSVWCKPQYIQALPSQIYNTQLAKRHLDKTGRSNGIISGHRYRPELYKMIDEDQIIQYYRGVKPLTRKSLASPVTGSLTNSNKGLGDTVVLMDITQAAASQGRFVSVVSKSDHFPLLSRFAHLPFANHSNPNAVDSNPLITDHDCGNGHCIQQFRRAFGLKVDDKPKACLSTGLAKTKNRCVLHFEPGPEAIKQRGLYHYRSRQLYPISQQIVEQFIANHPEWEFFNVGLNPITIKGAKPWINQPLDKTIRMVSTAEYFIGIVSGVMHLATAFDAKCVVVINIPSPEIIFLPVLVRTGQVEEEWFYPQNVHLHQDYTGPQVQQFTLLNLERAFAGEIYPYWSDKYLSLIHDKV